MLRNLMDLSQNTADGINSLLGTPVVSLYAAMTFVMWVAPHNVLADMM